MFYEKFEMIFYLLYIIGFLDAVWFPSRFPHQKCDIFHGKPY